MRHLGREAAVFDDAELQSHQNLQNLYNSTREAKVQYTKCSLNFKVEML